MLSTKLKEAAGNGADATLYVDDVFSTYLYTGNGSTQTITNGIDLAGKGGLVWIKGRSVATGNRLASTAQGVNNYLESNSTMQQQSDPLVTSFNAGGFSLGIDSNANGGGTTFASWTFREQAKFFDVVTYTGTGSARTIAHSLGVAPGMVIVKRTDTTSDWQVYSNGLTSAAYSIQLNSVNPEASAPTVWNSTAPTSSVFSVGTDATVNASGGTYVAYLFAHDTSSTGIIQCGSFTTDVSGNATVNLGWEPQYLLTKGSSNTEQWFINDVMRGFSSTRYGFLIANLADAEYTGALTDYFVPTATGFKVTQQTVGTYIYMAIRRPNKPPTTGTQVFSPIVSAAAAGTTLTTNFAIDMQMMAYRAGLTENSSIVDRLRGVSSTTTEISKSLRTSSTVAETVSPLLSQLWNNTGFNLPTGISGGSDIFWSFKRAPGFFDEVCYTGTGVATTQAHNLTVVPELMIVKVRNGVDNWVVYNSTIGANYFLQLSSPSAKLGPSTAHWNNTAPTPTVFSIGTDTSTNWSGKTFVAYLFATLAGISKVGSYTGNGTGQAIACGFSAGARFVLIKRTDADGGWYTFDSARGLTSGSSPYLLLNSNAAEVTGNNGVYASTGGFTLATSAAGLNASGGTYIFLAVA